MASRLSIDHTKEGGPNNLPRRYPPHPYVEDIEGEGEPGTSSSSHSEVASGSLNDPARKNCPNQLLLQFPLPSPVGGVEEQEGPTDHSNTSGVTSGSPMHPHGPYVYPQSFPVEDLEREESSDSSIPTRMDSDTPTDVNEDTEDNSDGPPQYLPPLFLPSSLETIEEEPVEEMMGSDGSDLEQGLSLPQPPQILMPTLSASASASISTPVLNEGEEEIDSDDEISVQFVENIDEEPPKNSEGSFLGPLGPDREKSSGSNKLAQKFFTSPSDRKIVENSCKIRGDSNTTLVSTSNDGTSKVSTSLSRSSSSLTSSSLNSARTKYLSKSSSKYDPASLRKPGPVKLRRLEHGLVERPKIQPAAALLIQEPEAPSYEVLLGIHDPGVLLEDDPYGSDSDDDEDDDDDDCSGGGFLNEERFSPQSVRHSSRLRRPEPSEYVLDGVEIERGEMNSPSDGLSIKTTRVDYDEDDPLTPRKPFYRMPHGLGNNSTEISQSPDVTVGRLNTLNEEYPGQDDPEQSLDGATASGSMYVDGWGVIEPQDNILWKHMTPQSPAATNTGLNSLDDEYDSVGPGPDPPPRDTESEQTIPMHHSLQGSHGFLDSQNSGPEWNIHNPVGFGWPGASGTAVPGKQPHDTRPKFKPELSPDDRQGYSQIIDILEGRKSKSPCISPSPPRSVRSFTTESLTRQRSEIYPTSVGIPRNERDNVCPTKLGTARNDGGGGDDEEEEESEEESEDGDNKSDSGGADPPSKDGDPPSKDYEPPSGDAGAGSKYGNPGNTGNHGSRQSTYSPPRNNEQASPSSCCPPCNLSAPEPLISGPPYIDDENTQALEGQPDMPLLLDSIPAPQFSGSTLAPTSTTNISPPRLQVVHPTLKYQNSILVNAQKLLDESGATSAQKPESSLNDSEVNPCLNLDSTEALQHSEKPKPKLPSGVRSAPEEGQSRMARNENRNLQTTLPDFLPVSHTKYATTPEKIPDTETRLDRPTRSAAYNINNKHTSTEWTCPSCGFLDYQRRAACLCCSFSTNYRANILPGYNKGPWACTWCGFPNFRCNVICPSCSLPTVPANPINVLWRCSSCGFVTYQREARCPSCYLPVALASPNTDPQLDFQGLPEEKTQSARPWRPKKNWNCSHCAFHNFRQRAVCNNCHLPAVQPTTASPTVVFQKPYHPRNRSK